MKFSRGAARILIRGGQLGSDGRRVSDSFQLKIRLVFTVNLPTSPGDFKRLAQADEIGNSREQFVKPARQTAAQAGGWWIPLYHVHKFRPRDREPPLRGS